MSDDALGPGVDPKDPEDGGDDSDAGRAHGLSRRTFIAAAGILGGAAAFDAAFAQARLITGPTGLTEPISSLLGELESVLTDTKPTFSFVLRRREDFLFLRVDGYNLRRSGQHLVRVLASADAYIVFTFQPQHITEQAYLLSTKKSTSETPRAPGKSAALMAYPSRIAFSLPSGRAIPLTVAGLLNWAALDPSLVATAAYTPIHVESDIAKPGTGGTKPVHPVKPAPRISQPSNVQTAIELPWHLVLSPTAAGRWSHPAGAITLNNWTELWHTRLAASSAEAAADGGPFRAVWNYDVSSNGRPTLTSGAIPPDANTPFRTSLDANDRYQIVHATSDFYITGREDAVADKLWLSTRGGFLDSNGVWEKLPPSYDLEQWKHLATLGRDHYVKIVKKGFLFPFGHRAVEVTITERLFQQVGGEIVATSRQIIYLVIREPTKSYDPADTFGVANDSRDLPFRSLTITTLRSPDLDNPQAFVSNPKIHIKGAALFSQDPFVPKVGGSPFLWHFIGTDWNGQQAEFTAPAVFVVQPDAFTGSLAGKVRDAYNALSPSDAVRVGTFTGQEVAFGPSHKAGDTNHSVQTITFGAGAGSGGSLAQYEDNDQPITYPNLAQAQVRLSAAAQAAGGTPLASDPIVSYHQTYVAQRLQRSRQTSAMSTSRSRPPRPRSTSAAVAPVA